MYLKVIKKNGVERLYFYESYYENKKVKQRCSKCLGNLTDLQKEYDDPIAHFKQVAAEETLQKKAERNISVSIDLSSEMDFSEDSLKNVGYGVLKVLYRQLELDKFWKQILKKSNCKGDYEKIFRLLVFSRILYPGSKKETFAQRELYFENMGNFSLQDIYRALDLFEKHSTELQKWIYDHSSQIYPRDMSVSYFDCTNYYFDIGKSDMDTLNEEGKPIDQNGKEISPKYRKRGPEKNHRPDPIVEMGLLMDRNGIPLAFDLFPGNESEKLHMRPIINRVKSEFNHSRTIFVADRGLNTSDNIYYLNGDNRGEENQRDGYVYGQSVRGADAEFKEWVLSGGYNTDVVVNDEGESIPFIHKSRIYPKKIHVGVTQPNGKRKKKEVLIDQKQMVYYAEKYAQKQKNDRAIMIARAMDLIEHPKKYDRITAAGSGAYVKNIAFDKSTGEIAEGKALYLDKEKIAEEEKLDGYYAIVTSELNLCDKEIRNIYRGLSRIEETFKISKSEFASRPVYVRTNPHIDGHFATCFTALVLLRLLQAKLSSQFPVGKMINSLRKYSCTKIDANIYQFVYYDEIIEKCGEVFGMELKNKYRTREQIRRMLKY